MAASPTPAACPVVLSWEPFKLCRAPMAKHHLACARHWSDLPKPLQQQIYHFWRHHRKLEHMKAIREAMDILNAPRAVPEATQPPLIDPEPPVGHHDGI